MNFSTESYINNFLSASISVSVDASLQLQFNLFVLLCRDTLIPSSLPEANITRYDVRWTETGIDPAKSKGNINAFLFISQTKFMAICNCGSDNQTSTIRF